MPDGLFDVVGLVIWVLVILAGLLAFLYPFIGERVEGSDKEKS